MGKDLNGNEIGEGVYQLSSKKYCARVSGFGKRISKTFDNLQEARLWVAEKQCRKSPSDFSDNMTLNEWYDYWMEEIKRPTVKESTYYSYKEVYDKWIRQSIGYMRLKDIKLIDCQSLINRELKVNKWSTVKHTLVCLNQLFDSAIDYELIDHSPAKKVTHTVDDKEERRVLTVEEQKRFVDFINEHQYKYRDEYMFILETGLRIGELLGLKWSDIVDGKIIVSRTMYWLREEKRYVETTPKTKAGKRIVPLTKKAYSILKNRKVTRMDYIFLDHHRNTKVNMCSSMDFICKKLGIERISPHVLRHTFATRCIEAGMKPKTLQKILGHATLSMTMDLYVHVTDDTLEKEMKKFERLVMGW